MSETKTSIEATSSNACASQLNLPNQASSNLSQLPDDSLVLITHSGEEKKYSSMGMQYILASYQKILLHELSIS